MSASGKNAAGTPAGGGGEGEKPLIWDLKTRPGARGRHVSANDDTQVRLKRNGILMAGGPRNVSHVGRLTDRASAGAVTGRGGGGLSRISVAASVRLALSLLRPMVNSPHSGGGGKSGRLDHSR
jgi:hypothetical protein